MNIFIINYAIGKDKNYAKLYQRCLPILAEDILYLREQKNNYLKKGRI